MAPLKQYLLVTPFCVDLLFSMPLKHGPIEALWHSAAKTSSPSFSMPLKHGPIEALNRRPFPNRQTEFSMPLKHGPIEALLDHLYWLR